MMSPRAFSNEPISETQLLTLFEAARWAPSSYNAQPWRFIYARRDSKHWPRFLGLLSAYNQSWARNAAALVILAAIVFMLVRSRLHHSLEAFDVAAYQRSPNELAGNRYNLDAQIDSQLRWDEGFGRILSVKPLDSSSRLSVFVPDQVATDLRPGQRFHMSVLVKEKGLLQVESLDKY